MCSSSEMKTSFLCSAHEAFSVWDPVLRSLLGPLQTTDLLTPPYRSPRPKAVLSEWRWTVSWEWCWGGRGRDRGENLVLPDFRTRSHAVDIQQPTSSGRYRS